MVTHDENRHEQRQVCRQSGAPSTSVISEEIRFKVKVKWPFLEKMGPSEVENHKNEKIDAGYLKENKTCLSEGKC